MQHQLEKSSRTAPHSLLHESSMELTFATTLTVMFTKFFNKSPLIHSCITFLMATVANRSYQHICFAVTGRFLGSHKRLTRGNSQCNYIQIYINSTSIQFSNQSSTTTHFIKTHPTVICVYAALSSVNSNWLGTNPLLDLSTFRFFVIQP